MRRHWRLVAIWAALLALSVIARSYSEIADEAKRGLKNATRLDLPLGHIGMVVSGRARDLCWTPLMDWLDGLGKPQQK